MKIRYRDITLEGSPKEVVIALVLLIIKTRNKAVSTHFDPSLEPRKAWEKVSQLDKEFMRMYVDG